MKILSHLNLNFYEQLMRFLRKKYPTIQKLMEGVRVCVCVCPSAKKFIYTYSIYNQLKLVLRRPAVWLSIFPICNLYRNFQDFF